MRRAALWLVWHVPLGPLAPWLLGYALGARPVRPPTIAEVWPMAERYGLALIPQSDGGRFRWLAVDIERVHYGGAIIIYPLEGCAESADTAAEAIARVVRAKNR